MEYSLIESDFKEKISNEIQLIAAGVDRYIIDTPFIFDDGDHLLIVLKFIGQTLVLTDEGNTFMHLTYDLDEKDLQKGTRQKIISNTLSSFNVSERSGELVMEIKGQEFGNSLYDFIQCLLHITDITYLSRERVTSTFLEDFRSYMQSAVPKERLTFDWHDPKLDPKNNYPIDCKINGKVPPLFVFAINSDDKARDTTITILQFEKWNTNFQSVVVFENQEEISRKVLARLSDVTGKQFSSLDSNRERISKYLESFLR
jgi:hypothetical protein